MPPRSKTPSRRAAAASPVKSPEPAKTPRAKAAAATTPKAVTPKAVTPKVQKAAKGSKKGGMSLLKYGQLLLTATLMSVTLIAMMRPALLISAVFEPKVAAGATAVAAYLMKIVAALCLPLVAASYAQTIKPARMMSLALVLMGVLLLSQTYVARGLSAAGSAAGMGLGGALLFLHGYAYFGAK